MSVILLPDRVPVLDSQASTAAPASLRVRRQVIPRSGKCQIPDIRCKDHPRITESPRRYDVTIIVDRDDGQLPSPAEFAVAAGQAASASIVSAHTAGQVISVVTVQATDQPAVVVLADVSEALGCPVSSTR
jgi:hypothetical protein